jgi:hypothetical protein
MFSHSFVSDVIVGSAARQPSVIASLITHIGHFISPDIAVWNTFFALVQVVIGAGLLFRRTVRPALAVSFVWVIGVWVFGEGLGMLFTGTATALTGAPGSVLLYGFIGLMAWPRREAGHSVGVASSAAGRGIGGATMALSVWAGYWSLAAVLFVLPDNRTQTSVSSAITGMAPGTPSWFAHFLTSFGDQFTSIGVESAWVLAIVSLIIGLGPVVARRPGPYLLAGGLLTIAMWVTAQGFIGGIFTGLGTDPNTGPLIILLALAMMPAVVPTGLRPPIGALWRRSPFVAVGGVAVIGAALALSATYPVAAQESSTSAMSGMTMPATSGSSTNAAGTTTSSCTAHQTGLKISGLDLSNSPVMIMSGHLGMDMNGADASAAAGLNTTKTNWHYTGPPLSQALATQLLAGGPNNPIDIHMAESGCAASVTASQQIKAVQYVQATTESAAQFANPLAALAAGYVAVSPANYPVVTYVNPTIVAANAAAKRALNPKDIDGLVYAKTPDGTEVLAAAMYILPSTVTKVPMPFGALVQWHERTNTCGTLTSTSSSPYDVTGVMPCASGTVQRATPYTTMVWQVPVAGGPLAIQPPDIQIVEAAVMAGGS